MSKKKVTFNVFESGTEVFVPAGNRTMCKNCEGTGVLYTSTGSPRRCSECDGSGMLKSSEQPTSRPCEVLSVTINIMGENTAVTYCLSDKNQTTSPRMLTAVSSLVFPSADLAEGKADG